MNPLPYSLDRSILICAQRSTVFRYFTDSRRFADWWGAGSHIEGRPGGAMKIVYPGGVVASGEVVEVVLDKRIVFTYGYEDPANPLRPGASRVTVTLEDHADGTWLTLVHELPDAAIRDQHVQGWRYQLALFANVAAADQQSGAVRAIDRYFELWAEADAAARRQGFAEIASADLRFHDKFSCTAGLDDLDAHLAAARIHLPGLTMHRSGEPRQCQGVALADFEVRTPDGAVAGRGTNLFQFTPDGRIHRVVGFW